LTAKKRRPLTQEKEAQPTKMQATPVLDASNLAVNIMVASLKLLTRLSVYSLSFFP
jgi:hypothetical protein